MHGDCYYARRGVAAVACRSRLAAPAPSFKQPAENLAFRMNHTHPVRMCTHTHRADIIINTLEFFFFLLRRTTSQTKEKGLTMIVSIDRKKKKYMDWSPVVKKNKNVVGKKRRT